MKLQNSKNTTLLFITVIALQFGVAGCGDNGTNTIPPPDFSTVPEPFDTTQAVSQVEMDNGLVIYTIEDGNGVFNVVANAKESILLFYTGRTADGEIFASSYANGNTAPSRFSNLTPETIGQSSALIEGFRLGLIGMSEGERRTLVIPPDLGYGGSNPGTNGYNLRNDTLIYDVELAEIVN